MLLVYSVTKQDFVNKQIKLKQADSNTQIGLLLNINYY